MNTYYALFCLLALGLSSAHAHDNFEELNALLEERVQWSKLEGAEKAPSESMIESIKSVCTLNAARCESAESFSDSYRSLIAALTESSSGKLAQYVSKCELNQFTDCYRKLADRAGLNSWEEQLMTEFLAGLDDDKKDKRIPQVDQYTMAYIESKLPKKGSIINFGYKNKVKEIFQAEYSKLLKVCQKYVERTKDGISIIGWAAHGYLGAMNNLSADPVFRNLNDRYNMCARFLENADYTYRGNSVGSPSSEYLLRSIMSKL